MRNDNNVDKGDSDPCHAHAIDMCLSLASRVQCVKVRIYNFIRDVGRGETTADNALHCLVEDYKVLGDIANELDKLSNMLEGSKDGKA